VKEACGPLPAVWVLWSGWADVAAPNHVVAAE